MGGVRVLFVHQAFPAQFQSLATHLIESGHEIVAAGDDRFKKACHGVEPRWIGYRLEDDDSDGYARGNTAAAAMRRLRDDGFYPDVIIAHPAWGEAVYLKDVFERAKLLLYCEWYHAVPQLHDAEVPVDTAPDMRIANRPLIASLDSFDWGVSPTKWQRAQFPARYQHRISVIFDGVDTDKITPAAQHDAETLTYVSRGLEPVRGFHVFMRALPELQRRRPNLRVTIIGADDVYYSSSIERGYGQRALNELYGAVDLSRITFTGPLPYAAYIDMIRKSAVHLYASYPFILSWSMVEAMAAGCLVVGSNTPPVAEVIRDGENGLLYDYSSPGALAARVDEALSRADAGEIRARARRTAVERYDLKSVCLPAQVKLLDDLVAGRLH